MKIGLSVDPIGAAKYFSKQYNHRFNFFKLVFTLSGRDHDTFFIERKVCRLLRASSKVKLPGAGWFIPGLFAVSQQVAIELILGEAKNGRGIVHSNVRLDSEINPILGGAKDAAAYRAGRRSAAKKPAKSKR